MAAKTYRSMPEPPPVLFAKMNTSLLPDIYDAAVRNSSIAEIMDRYSFLCTSVHPLLDSLAALICASTTQDSAA